jgi:type IV pilus assembly protein PilE
MHRRNERGITLMELMIVMVVVAILAAIAYPSYRQQTIRTNRTAAKTALMNTAALLERCYTRSLAPAYNSAECNATVSLPVTTEGGLYQINHAAAPTATTFSLIATPQGGQTDDRQCGTLGLTNTNLRTATGTASATAAQTCWQR